MPVFVDDVRHRFRRMIMCHLWASTEIELDEFAKRLGLSPKWKQNTSWVHYDISLSVKTKALDLGAILTDKYGPLEHVAMLKGNFAQILLIHSLRERWKKSA